jgi:hypothetical protein
MTATIWDHSLVPLTAAGKPVLPWFGAIVDSVDPSAVVNLLAVLPNVDGSGLRAFERKNGGWIESPDFLRDLNGLTPPPVVELDLETLKAVIEQIDSYDAKKSEG